jgi:hypothetical protein
MLRTLSEVTRKKMRRPEMHFGGSIYSAPTFRWPVP